MQIKHDKSILFQDDRFVRLHDVEIWVDWKFVRCADAMWNAGIILIGLPSCKIHWQQSEEGSSRDGS